MAVFSAIAAGIGIAGSFLTSTALGSALLMGALSTGIGMLQKSMMGKPEAPQFGVEGKLQSGGDLPLSFIMGRGMTAGQLVYANTADHDSNDPNHYLCQVIKLSNLPIKSLDAMWVDGEKVTIDYTRLEANGYVVTEYISESDKNRPKLWVRFYDGTQTSADARMVELFSAHPKRPYKNTRVGKGCAYVVVIARIDEDLYQGFPAFKFECSGVRLYDPSKDTSVGGSGAQRWATPSTWGGDGDLLPAVQIYNLLRGISYAGQWVYGVQGLGAARLPVADWIAEIAKCRSEVSIGGGQTQPAFRAGGEIKCDVEIGDATEEFLTACHGRLAEIGGAFKLRVGAPAASTFSFSDDFLLADEEHGFRPILPLADSVNSISASFPNPGDAWNMKDAKPLIRTDLEAEDGARRLPSNVTMTLVSWSQQVRRLMTFAIKEARRARRHVIIVPSEAWEIEPLDTVSWTSVDFGYVTKQFRVDRVHDRGNLSFILELTEIDPNDFDPGVIDYPPLTTGGGNIKVIPAPQTVPGFQVFAMLVQNAAGQKRPAIELRWLGDNLNSVASIAWQIRLSGETDPLLDGSTQRVDLGKTVVASAALLPATGYEARAIPTPSGRNRRVAWTAWQPVTTPDAKFGANDLYDNEVDWAKLGPDLKKAMEWTGSEAMALKDQLFNLALKMADQDFKNFQSRQQLRSEARASYEQLTANYQNLVTVAVGDVNGKLTAVSQRVETLTANLDGKASSAAVDALSVRVMATENSISSQGVQISGLQSDLAGKANASALNSLQTQVDQVQTTADGKNRVFRQSTAPSATRSGDLWIKTSEGNKVYVATGTGTGNWTLSDDQRIPDLVTQVSAQADSLTAVQARTNRGTASGAIRMQASSGPSGVSSRIGIQASAESDTGYQAASLFLDVLAGGGTRVAILADKFVIADSSSVSSATASPFIFESGVAKMREALIPTLTSGLIRSTDNSVRIELDNNRILMADSS